MAAKKVKTTYRTSSSSNRQRQAAPARQAKKEKTARTWRTVGIVILSVLLLAILAAAGLGIAYLVTDGFGGKAPTTIVMVGDKIYTEDTNGVTIYPGDEIRVQSLTGAEGYTFRIEANGEKDFAFTVGEEPYSWKDLAGRDMTKGFTIEETENGFTVDYTDLEGVIAAVLGAEVTIGEDADTSGDLFVLVLTCGEKDLRLSFGVGLPVEGVEVDPDHVIVGGAEDPAEQEEPAADEPAAA